MADHFDSGAAISPETENEGDEAEGSSTEEILEIARARFALAVEAERETRILALDDLGFLAGKQWPSDIEAERMREHRPCLVVNRLPQHLHQITNDQRQNRPAIKVHAGDNQAKDETAEVIQGLIRHIEYDSNAEVAYDTAFEGAAGSSFGFYRIRPEYVSPDSFDQKLVIEAIPNQFSVYLDPNAKRPDGSDANWGFITDDLLKDDYEEQYPDSKLASFGADWASIGSQAPGWMIDGSTRVAEYFAKEYKNTTLYRLSSGETVRKEKLVERMSAAMAAGVDCQVVNSRETKIPVIKWRKINAIEILEETELPIQWIPILPVYGTSRIINGKRILESVIRHAKDPQRMHNYWKSAETEAIALAPRTPFLIAEGQVEGYELDWEESNKKNQAYLTYKATNVAGQPVPPPQRLNAEPAIAAITQAAMGSIDDIKSTTGVFDAQTGAQGNEISGKAIDSRKSQVQASNFHFVDNLTRSLKHAGRILVDWIPHIYDTAQAARIIGDDGTQRVVMLNQEHEDESGKKVLYDLTTGRYDVTVDTGPSYATKRQEAAESMIEFQRALPETGHLIADLIAGAMDWPGAKALADRLKKTLPPALQDDPKTKDIPPQLIAQMQHQAQMIDGLTKNLNEATKVIETKQLELEHRERIEVLKLQTDAEIQMAKLGSSEAIAMLQAKFTEMEHRLEFLKMNQPIDAPDNFNPEGADGGNYAGIGHIGGTENLTGGDSPGSPVE